MLFESFSAVDPKLKIPLIPICSAAISKSVCGSCKVALTFFFWFLPFFKRC